MLEHSLFESISGMRVLCAVCGVSRVGLMWIVGSS